MTNRDCDPIEQQARNDELERLYALDGRHNHDHPMHCFYSGLAVKYAQQEESK